MVKKSRLRKIRQKIRLYRKMRQRRRTSRKPTEKHRFSVFKWLTKIFCYALVMLFFLTAGAFVFLDSLLHFGITVIGSKITGCAITLDRVELSLTSGNIKITNLKIANPDGFSRRIMLETAYCYLSVNPGTIFSGEVVFRELELRNFRIYPEITADRKFNLHTLKENLNRHFSEQNEKSSPRSYSLKNLSIANAALVTSDQREQQNINGFSILFNSLTGNSDSGQYSLHGLQIIPSDVHRSNCLEIRSAALKLHPGSGNSSLPAIRNCEINGLTTGISIKGRERHVLRDIYDTIMMLASFAPPSDTPAAGVPEIYDFTMRDIAISVRDKTNSRDITTRLALFQGSFAEGKAVIENFTISSIRNRNNDLLRFEHADLCFIPNSVFSNEITISNLNIKNINASTNIYDRDSTDIHELTDTVEDVIYSIDPEKTEIIVKVDSFDLCNGILQIRDKHSGNQSANNFDLKFNAVHSSWKKGTLSVDTLEVSAPAIEKIKLLQLDSAAFEFIPESLNAPTTVIEKMAFKGVNAVAILDDDKRTDIYKITGVLQALISPFYSGNITAEAQKNSESSIIINNYTMNNSRIFLLDRRKEATVSGVTCYLEKLYFSRAQGIFDLYNLDLSNPRNYRAPHLLTIDSIKAFFPKGTTVNDLDSLEIDGAHISMEFKSDGKNNLHESTDALCFLISRKKFDCRQASLTPDNATGSPKSTNGEPPFVIRKFSLNNSSFSLYDARQQASAQKVPLADTQENIVLDSGGQSDLETTLHSTVLALEKKCDGLTDPGKLFMEQFDKAAGQGIRLLKDCGTASGNLFRTIFTPFN